MRAIDITATIIKQTVFEHFKYLPRLLGFNVRENERLNIVNCGLGSSMFNIVCNTHLEKWAKNSQDIECLETGDFPVTKFPLTNFHMYGENAVRKKVQEVIDFFEKQPFAWWISPSCDPYWIRGVLKETFQNHSTEHAMACDLSKYDCNVTHGLEIQQVLSLTQLNDFISMLEPYDSSARAFFKEIKEWMLKENERLFVGYENGVPVVISSLYIDRENSNAGIFNLITKEERRGLGFGTKMMHHLLKYAKDHHLNYASLIASSDSGYRIYQRLGFETLGKFECFEWDKKL